MSDTILLQTPLYEAHQQAGGKLVDFAGWSLPIHYGSQVEEHHLVRGTRGNGAGMFDVSHMTVVDVRGPQAQPWLQYLLAGDVARLSAGEALYSAMLNQDGGVIDDLIVYQLDDAGESYRVIVNAATRSKDLAWMGDQQAGFEVQIVEQSSTAMLAVQGPKARALAAAVLQERSVAQADELLTLQRFSARKYTHGQEDWFIARTGYTGEDGFELVVPASQAMSLWADLLAAGVHPAGLGARDTLRLEACMNLYGQDMDESVTPLESNMGWTVHWKPQERDFIGRAALQSQREARKESGDGTRLGAIVLLGKGVLRHDVPVFTTQGEGIITSGAFSPSAGCGIGLARVPMGAQGDCEVEIRGRRHAARLIKGPFVREGQVLLD